MNKKALSIIAAFILSVIIWGSVNLSNDYYLSLSVPLKLLGMPAGYTSSANTVKEVNIRLKGAGWKLASLMLNRNLEFIVPAVLDSGRRFIKLNDAIGENQWLTSGIQVFRIDPDTLSFKIERIRQKKVKIYADLDLSFKTEFGITSEIKLYPDSVIIYGPRSLLRKIDSIPTIKKVFADLDNPVTTKIELKPIDGISYLSNIFNLHFEVHRIADKYFESIPVEVQNIPHNQDLVLFPNSINITVRGGISTLGKMQREDIHSYVEFQTAYNDSTGAIVPIIKVPEYVSVIDIKPSQLKYIIKKY